MTSTPACKTRIDSLDSLRGIAALIVLFNHMTLAFAPAFNGALNPEAPHSLFGTPLFAFVNGGAAVILFFILSGFVLTFRFFESGQAGRIPDASIKRWPRLAFPVILVSLLSGCLMVKTFYFHSQVAALNHSLWLSRLFPWFPTGSPELWRAFKQGAFGTFWTGDSSYNINFWTMHFELIGSFAAYFLAFLTIRFFRSISWRIIIAGMGLLWLWELYRFPYLSCFILGIILALLYSRYPYVQWRSFPALTGAILVVLLLSGYAESETNHPGGIYSFLEPEARRMGLAFSVLLYSIASLLLIGMALWAPVARQVLGYRMPKILGHFSFPIYLLHLLVICSLSSWIYLHCLVFGTIVAASAAMIVTLIFTIALSWPLVLLDDLWLGALRQVNPVARMRKSFNPSLKI